jgi:hypothetical protein
LPAEIRHPARTTRRQILTASLGLCAAACRRGPPDLAGFTEEEPPRLSASVDVANPQTAPQLVSGWYPVEANWRWTAPKFTAVLRPPPGAAARGAILRFHFTLPDVIISQLKVVTLRAAIEGTPLTPERYSHSGKAVYARDLPGHLLSGDRVHIDFGVDRPFRPGPADPRDLGVVAERVGLETK